MSDGEKKLIIEYATPPLSVMIVGAVFLCTSPIAFFISRAVSSDPKLPIVLTSVMAAMGLIMICFRFYYAALAKSAVKEAIKNAGEIFLIGDFRNGRRFLNDRIICGEHYIFSKGMGVIVRLSDIDEIIRKTQYYKSVPTAEKLTVKLKNGKSKIISSISLAEGRTPPFAQIITEMTKNAPDIRYTDKRL